MDLYSKDTMAVNKIYHNEFLAKILFDTLNLNEIHKEYDLPKTMNLAADIFFGERHDANPNALRTVDEIKRNKEAKKAINNYVAQAIHIHNSEQGGVSTYEIIVTVKNHFNGKTPANYTINGLSKHIFQTGSPQGRLITTLKTINPKFERKEIKQFFDKQIHEPASKPRGGSGIEQNIFYTDRGSTAIGLYKRGIITPHKSL